jgi:hypothetical protein
MVTGLQGRELSFLLTTPSPIRTEECVDVSHLLELERTSRQPRPWSRPTMLVCLAKIRLRRRVR